MTFSVQELAERVSGHVEGDPSCVIHGLAAIQAAGPGQLTYVSGLKYMRHVGDCQAAALVGPAGESAPAMEFAELRARAVGLGQLGSMEGELGFPSISFAPELRKMHW